MAGKHANITNGAAASQLNLIFIAAKKVARRETEARNSVRVLQKSILSLVQQ